MHHTDFVGQGAANIAAGALQGMPVGGSMSASALAVSGGAKSRLAIVIAGVVMAVVVLLFAGPVGYIAMPALSGLLITVGVRTIKPGQIVTVLRTGRIQQMVLGVTFVLTMLIPLQFAVLIGVGTSMILYIVRQSTQISLVRLQIDDDDHVLDDVVPDVVPSATVLILEPVGSLFFAAAPAFEEMLPEVNHDSTDSVVILRLRGRDDVGATLIEVFRRYAQSLDAVGSKLVLASVQPGVEQQLPRNRCDRCHRGRQHLPGAVAHRHAAARSRRCLRMDRLPWRIQPLTCRRRPRHLADEGA